MVSVGNSRHSGQDKAFGPPDEAQRRYDALGRSGSPLSALGGALGELCEGLRSSGRAKSHGGSLRPFTEALRRSGRALGGSFPVNDT